jgi:hypothetical protein
MEEVISCQFLSPREKKVGQLAAGGRASRPPETGTKRRAGRSPPAFLPLRGTPACPNSGFQRRNETAQPVLPLGDL